MKTHELYRLKSMPKVWWNDEIGDFIIKVDGNGRIGQIIYFEFEMKIAFGGI